MTITFYNTADPVNKINKTLTDPVTLNGKLVDSFNMTSPVIIVRGKITSNYCFIESLKRYFFVDSVKYDGDKAVIYLRCDVLESHKTDILNATVHVTENETGEPFISNRNGKYDVRPIEETLLFDGEFIKSNIIMVTLKGDK